MSTQEFIQQAPEFVNEIPEWIRLEPARFFDALEFPKPPQGLPVHEWFDLTHPPTEEVSPC